MPSNHACRSDGIPAFTGRRWALVVPLILALMFSPSRSVGAETRPTLYVFLHTDVKSTVLEKTLQGSLPDLVVTVFGRFRDFEQALSAHPPDAVLALQPLLEARKLSATLRGIGQGRDVEPYVLMSVGNPLAGSLAGRTIGVVDLLGRTDTQTFVLALLKAPEARLKLVTKLEDLLSLLQFAAADAILVPARIVKSFTERSRLSLQVRALPDVAVGRASVAVLTPAARATVVRGIERLDVATNQLMGVESWRER